ncbi:MAG: DUF692 domain-containing protein [Nitrospinae bacterium]|nr:DUF692 domain-containing protein [Nitrospinota bacterium]
MPAKAGIGLRAPHYREILATLPAAGWFEVHSENFFGDGGQPLHFLEQIRSHYPIALHGVGLSLGSAGPLDRGHLARIKSLAGRFQPGFVSEHLSWAGVDGRYSNCLLPLPYTEESLKHVCRRVERVQEFLGRRILIENVSSYLQFKQSTVPEWEFIAAVAARAGCGILLDVNNIYVSAVNHGFDPSLYLQAIPRGAVEEIHLAGFEAQGDILVDTHSRPVYEDVWELYKRAVLRFGITPTLIEWDADIPPLAVLLEEAWRANAVMEGEYAFSA